MLTALFRFATHIASFLIVLVGSIGTIALLMWVLVLLINRLYKNMKISFYFISFVRHRRAFITWYRKTK